jgi:transposase
MVINFSDKGNYKSFKKTFKKYFEKILQGKKIILILDNVRYHHDRG